MCNTVYTDVMQTIGLADPTLPQQPIPMQVGKAVFVLLLEPLDVCRTARTRTIFFTALYKDNIKYSPASCDHGPVCSCGPLPVSADRRSIQPHRA